MCIRDSYITQRSKFDELNTVEILEASSERVMPPCLHADVCGGCSLQYMSVDAQISYKENVLKEQFKHFGNLVSNEWFEPIIGDSEGYRTKARLGVVYVNARDEVIIGFREKRNKLITNIESCTVLDSRAGNSLSDYRRLIASLSIRQHIPQIEIAMGDESVALVIRHMVAFTDDDLTKLRLFGEQFEFEVYLQPGDASTVHKIWPENSIDRLYFSLSLPDLLLSDNAKQKQKNLKLAFHPTDFTQVNSTVNQKMVSRALEWLDIQSTDRVLDLFCGLGNFTIPMAYLAKEVVGVEGSEAMVSRGAENAELNDLDNVSFSVANLQTDFKKAAWVKKGFDKILIDPPRSGALDIVNHISKFKAQRIVYVSCNPATLARDSGILIDKGYKLMKAGVMDMFPHTSHVESIALFEKDHK